MLAGQSERSRLFVTAHSKHYPPPQLVLFHRRDSVHAVEGNVMELVKQRRGRQQRKSEWAHHLSSFRRESSTSGRLQGGEGPLADCRCS